MANKISHLFSLRPLRMTPFAPYLTPRTLVISALALTAVATFVYLLRKNFALPPVDPTQPSEKETPTPGVATPQQTEIVTPAFPAPKTPHFEDNVQTIVAFPADAHAKLSSFEGKLERTESFFRPIELQGGTKFSETVGVIQGTVLQASALFDERLKAIEDKLKAEDKIQLLLPLSEALIQEKALLEGIIRIQDSYRGFKRKKYREGLKAIAELCENRKIVLISHLRHFQALTQTLQKSVPLSLDFTFPPTDIASKELRAYCQTYCNGLGLTGAESMIAQGQILLREIFNNDRQPATEPEKSQEELSQITWFLTYCALKKNQGHYDYSFAIEDHSKLYEFLKKSPASYERRSNEHVGRSCEKQPEAEGYALKSSSHHNVDVDPKLMPAHKRTLLFARIRSFDTKERVLFFKPDNFGTHSSADLLTTASKLITTLQKETHILGIPDDQKIPGSIQQAFTALIKHIESNMTQYEPFLKRMPYLFDSPSKAHERVNLWGIAYILAFVQEMKKLRGYPISFNGAAAPLEAALKSLDQLDQRTEKVPAWIHHAFVGLMSHISDNLKQYEPFLMQLPYEFQVPSKAKKLAQLWGIAYMHDFIQQMKQLEDYPDEFNDAAVPLEVALKSLDHLDKRTGREIYLTTDELQDFLSATL